MKLKLGDDFLMTDEELVCEILQGNEPAMEILAKRYYKVIFAYIYRTVGEYHSAYDLTQEVFVKMMKGLSKYKESQKFKSWLFTIASNTCKDYYRCSEVKVIKDDIDDKYIVTKLVDEKNNVVSIVDKNMNMKIIREALQELPQHQREALILKYYHDLKTSEIAEVTKNKEATVKSRLRQGIGKLRKILSREEDMKYYE
jgi:RNA polymerase sigma-70 factor (ECF subfamily)